MPSRLYASSRLLKPPSEGDCRPGYTHTAAMRQHSVSEIESTHGQPTSCRATLLAFEHTPPCHIYLSSLSDPLGLCRVVAYGYDSSSSSAIIFQVRSPSIGGRYVAGSEAWHTVLEVANCNTGKHTGSPRPESRPPVFEVAINRSTSKHTGSPRPEPRPPQIVCV